MHAYPLCPHMGFVWFDPPCTQTCRPEHSGGHSLPEFLHPFPGSTHVALPYLMKNGHRTISFHMLSVHFGISPFTSTHPIRGEKVTPDDGRTLAAMNAHLCAFAYGGHTVWPSDFLLALSVARKIVQADASEEGIFFFNNIFLRKLIYLQ